MNTNAITISLADRAWWLAGWHSWEYYDNGRYPKVEYRVCSRCCNIEQLDEIAVKHWI